MKKAISALLALFMLLATVSLTASALTEATVTMYTLDGRTAQIEAKNIEAWKAVGWHEGSESIGVYAADGRTMYVFYKDLAAYKNVGWYISPVVTMYAADGRTIQIADVEIEEYKKVGWYVSPVVTVYAPDGRAVQIASIDVEAWKAVGWYDYKVTTVYNNSGNSMVIAENSLSAYKSKGWHEGTETIGLYSADDTTIYVFYKDLAAYLNVGWYTKPVPNYKKAYADVLYNYMKVNELYSDSAFNLIHIDDDEIPELVIRNSTSYTSGVMIYVFKNGNVSRQYSVDNNGEYIYEFGTNGDIKYNPKKGTFINHSYFAKISTIIVYELSDAGFTYPVMNAYAFLNDPKTISCTVNGNNVSYSAYESALNPYVGGSSDNVKDAFGSGGYSISGSKVKSVLGY